MQPQNPQDPNGLPLPPNNNPTSPTMPQPPVQPVVPTPPATPYPPVQPIPPQQQSTPLGTSPTMPQPQSSFTSQPQPLMTASAYKQGRNLSKKIILASVIVGVLLLIGGGVFAFTKMTGGIKLAKYSGSKFEILYPGNYEKKEFDEGRQVLFTEPDSKKDAKNSKEDKLDLKSDLSDMGDNDSAVIVAADEIPEEARKEIESKKEDFFNSFEKQLKDGSSDDNKKIVLDKSERTKHLSNDALILKGVYKKKGKKVGNINIVIALGNDKYYVIMVVAHDSDPGVQKKADKIIDSFKLK